MEDLKLIVLDNIKEIGEEVDNYLQEMNYSTESYILHVTRDRFSNGEAKITIDETVRDKDVYILSDVGNYSITYKMHGMTVPMGPDEHFQDIKRCISALSGYARRITVITPLLYQSRQDKRKSRESLDCAIGLQELERLGINHFDKLYTTNLTYIPEKFKAKEWLEVVNCSKRIADIIDHIHKGKSLKNIVHNNEKVLTLLRRK